MKELSDVEALNLALEKEKKDKLEKRVKERV